MGCCGSGDSELKGRLDAAENTANAHPSAVGDAGLDDMAKCAQEIRYVMQLLIAQGAKDKDSIRRIEKISDAILGNLISRVTLEELKKGEASYRPVVDKIVKVSLDLDAVRATKASDAVISHVQSIEARIEAALSQHAAPILIEIKAKRRASELAGPADLASGSKEIMDRVEKAHSVSQGSTKVTGELLDQIVAQSVWILSQDKAWSADYASCQIVSAIAERLDAIATKLVVVMGAVWDPPMLPQVRDISKAAAERHCAQELRSADEALVANNAGGAHDALKALVQWWPMLKEAGEHTLEIVGIFSKVQTYTTDAFTKATAAGDSATAEAIRGFSSKFDELRNGFDGLAPPGEAATLGESLSAAEAKGAVMKAIGILDGELAKTMDDDKSTQLSLAATVQALESLVSQWPKARSGEEDLADQLDASCSAVEAWTLKTAESLPAARIAGLVKFAEEYDSRRTKLVPPATKNGPLRPRIASLAAFSHLRVVDAELAKAGGLNPSLIKDALKAAVEAIPGDSGTAEVREHLKATFTGVDERLLKTFGEMMSSGAVNQNKEVMLTKFAAVVDELRLQGSLGDGEDALVTRMEAKRSGMAAEAVAKIEADAKNLQPGSGAGPDFASIIEALRPLQATCAKAPLTEEHGQRLGAVFGELGDKLTEACGKAAADGSLKAVDEFLRLACEMDAAIASLALEPRKLQSSLMGLATLSHLTAAEKTLRVDDPPDCAVLTREMAAVENLCLKAPCSADMSRQILSFVDAVEKPLIEKMVRVDAAAAKPVIEAAAAVDKARAAAEGSEGSGDISAKVAGVQAPSAKLAEAKMELGKSSGMNPNTVVKVIKELQLMWEPVKDCRPVCEGLMEVAALFATKLEEACKKALAAEADVRDKKVQAVLGLSQDADTAMEPLIALSKDLAIDKMREALARAVADHFLASLDTELAKETGRSPVVMLACSQELAKVWPDLGGASAMDAAFDEVARIKDRWKEAHSTVKTRMQESLEDALKTSNEKKKEALLKFAADFDMACKDFSEGELAEELRAKMES